ncbi:TonB-dependent receptor [Luteimonas panaciterrae]|uniref:TonB-dependent receptor n=1 Tax=Luteimonas panaciterrae TaxID=363885 RepID=UPI001CFAB6AE|nr:TonB-dependent receptor [Luteimonas panaciterrae]
MSRPLSSPLRNGLTLALAAILTPAYAADLPSTAPADEGASPPSDTRHAQDAAKGRHVKDLDSVIVTASPLRDTAAQLSKPTDVLAGERLDENRAASLGETISSIPGVQSSNFGPGVGRPILRGLDGPRVEVLSSGMSTEDVSTVSQDHSPAVESFLADQIEVLKGPSTLLYGTGAIGGVVNVVDGRIPEAPIEGGFSGRAEARFYGGDQSGSTDMARIDGGNDRFALHADAVYRNAKDYDTPDGKQPNSFIDTKTGSVGGSLLGDWGFVGMSVSRFEDDYGNPGEAGDLAAGERGVHLQLRQNRYDLKGGLTDPWGEGSGLRFSFSHTDYKHIEFEGDEPGTTFKKDANEGRLEASYSASNGWKGAVGLQGSDGTFSAVGEESFVPRTTTRALGVFGVARKSWDMDSGKEFQLDLGARVDKVKAEPDGLDKRDFTPVSLSVAGGFKLDENWRLTVNLDHAERAPAEEELFADGPHLATLAYEIGNPDLDKEAANQIEFGLQYKSDFVDAKVSAYYNRFKDFIYLVDTGEQWHFEEEDEFLPIRQWSQRDATFRGFEGEATFHLADNDNGRWDLRTFGDTVRATLADGGGNVPRIAPSRLGAQLRWENNGWRASLGATRYNKQDKVAANETPTDGYTLVDAHAAYHFDGGRLAWELFVDGSNLTNQEAHVHTSFLKDVVALPGRSVSGGVRIFF